MKVSRDRPVWAVGFMTGTSMDGVDAAALETDGETVGRFGPGVSEPFTEAEREAIRRAMEWAAAHWPHHGKLRKKTDLWDIPEIREAEARLHEAHCRAIGALAAPLYEVLSHDPPRWRDLVAGAGRVHVLGFHGQTLLHRPEAGYTLQIGDAALLARNERLPAPVVHDFRSDDVAAGGEGAPLVPVFHHALARRAGLTEPLAFLNIGGVANVTWCDPAIAAPEAPGALLAFDTGPGNALIDDWMRARTGRALDAGGQAAAAGRVHADRLASNSARAYLDRTPPKSLDRNDFAGVLSAMEGLTTEDGAATLTACTADCVAGALRHMPAPPSRWLVCGGGRLNATMMRMLAARLDAPVEPVEAVGLDGDMLEAQAFAYLAVRVLRGLPTSVPSTTGCRQPVSGGRICAPGA